MKKGSPITPDQIDSERVAFIPPEVFDAFNELIVEEWQGTRVTVRQPAVIARIRQKLKEANGEGVNEIPFVNSFLEIDDIYRQAGWTVEYDKPAYNESEDAYWVFSKKRQRLND